MKRKCPRCGSSDVIEIPQTLPEVTGNDPTAHCNACGMDFGKPPFLRRRKGQPEDEPRELYPDVVTGITFSEGGYFGGTDLLEIRTKDGVHIFDYARFPDVIEPYFGVIPDAKWKRIMKSLFYRLCIHEWKKRYDSPDTVLDGTQWELELRLTKGRHYTISGSNAFPPLYKSLVRVFKPYMKKIRIEFGTDTTE